MKSKISLFLQKYGYIISAILICFAYVILYHWNRDIPSNAGGNSGFAEFQLAISVMIIDGFAIALLSVSMVILLVETCFFYHKKQFFGAFISFTLIIFAITFMIHGIKLFGDLAPPTY